MIDKYMDMLKYLSAEYDDFSYVPNRKELINAEMFFMFLYINKIKPEVIFESGYWQGRSSLIILETLKRAGIKCDYYIACILKKPHVYFDHNYDNFNLIMGKGEQVINNVAKSHGGKRMLSLIDGPKFRYYDKCEKIYDSLFSNFDIQAIFQHDTHRPKDMRNYQRYYDSKVDKNKYGLHKIGELFLDKYCDLLNEENLGESKMGLICDNDLLIKDISI